MIRQWLRDHGFHEFTINDEANELGKGGNIRRYGRWYVSKDAEGGGEAWGAKIAWHVGPKPQASVALEIASNDGYDGVMWHIGTPLVRLWFEITGGATREFCEWILPGYWAKRGEAFFDANGLYRRPTQHPRRIPGEDMYKVIRARVIKLLWDGNWVHWCLWGDPMQSDGGITGSVFLDTAIFGRRRYRRRMAGPPVEAIVAFPEGNYEVILQRQVEQWKYSRFGTRHLTRESVEIKLRNANRGPLFRGKGENSWDCGDDMIISMSSDGHSYEHAVASYVEAVLRNRKRYGHVEPRDRAIDREKVLA